MMMARTYLVDSDVFITAKNVYYAFDLCSGFWKSVVQSPSVDEPAGAGADLGA